MKSKLIKTFTKHNLKMFAVYENDTDDNTKLYLVPKATMRFTADMTTQHWPKFDTTQQVNDFIKFVEAAE
jgi:hypothetical protein